MSEKLETYKKLKMKKKNRTLAYLKHNWILYVLISPTIIFFIVFHLWPIAGMRLAFQDFRIIGANVWVGLKHFKILFGSPAFMKVLSNTIIISMMKLFLLMPIPVILSLLLNELKGGRFRKYIQSIIYLPHFFIMGSYSRYLD